MGRVNALENDEPRTSRGGQETCTWYARDTHELRTSRREITHSKYLVCTQLILT